MKLNINSLTDVDPLRVPLPHGTEVTTRVDRQIEGRVVKQGAVGRVRAGASCSLSDFPESRELSRWSRVSLK